MNYNPIKTRCRVLLIAFGWLPFLTLNAQSSEQLPRTPLGRPDFSGLWNNASQTPIERPVALGTKKTYSLKEAQALEAQALVADAQRAAPLPPGRDAPEKGARIMFQADENFANSRIQLTQIAGEYRTSLIIEPDTGRFPYVEDGANKDIFGQWRAQGHGPFDGPEIRSQMERCLHVGAQMPPMMAWAYNANYQIVQTKDYFMLMSEMVHDARIIPIDKTPQSPAFTRWLGNSLGHWQGNTFVVRTTGFHPQQSNFFIKSSDQLEVVEYFDLVSANEIIYRYTATDPIIYSEPFTMEMQLLRKPANESIFEFACHEGNYSLPSILAGARRVEADARTSTE